MFHLYKYGELPFLHTQVFSWNPYFLTERMNSSSSSSPNRERVKWTLEENKLFENAIAEFDPGSPDFFEKISERIPEKTLKQTEDHFLILIEDVEKIESGLTPLPDYGTTSRGDKGKGSNSNDKPKQRKKGVPWTGEEHEYV